LVGAGDIASCANHNDEATAKLLDGIPGTVFAAGDTAYDSGTAAEFNNCYDPTWGRHKARTYPVPGNHEYRTANASGYFGYYGAVAGDPSRGYYSYNLGQWHIVALNSMCDHVGGCTESSPMVT
jgi:acid phosphatase type 7